MSVDLPPQGSGGFFMSARKPIVIYDTTLRDGAQGPAVSFSAADKERIARLLDGLGFDYVEGGFPGSNPKDEELFARLAQEPLGRSRLAAFGATRRAGGRCEDDANLKALADSGAPVGTLVGNSDTWPVATVLPTTNNANLAIVEASATCPVAANSRAQVMAGADMGQGPIEGFRQLCGTLNHVSVASTLVPKLGVRALPAESVEKFSELSRTVPEIANLALPRQQPFVGHGAFAHKGGQHVAAVLRHKDAYQHIDPVLVGNEARVLVSELSGRGNVLAKAREFGLELDRDDPQTRWLVNHLKELEHQGYSYEAADASFEMLVRRLQPGYSAPWTVADFTTQVRKNGGSVHAEATVKVEVDGTLYHTAASGNGPVNALDAALRKALSPRFPALDDVSLHDYKVRILNGDAGTAATTRVLVESGRGTRRWTTVGCSSNIIEASLLALVDSLEYAVSAGAD